MKRGSRTGVFMLSEAERLAQGIVRARCIMGTTSGRGARLYPWEPWGDMEAHWEWDEQRKWGPSAWIAGTGQAGLIGYSHVLKCNTRDQYYACGMMQVDSSFLLNFLDSGDSVMFHWSICKAYVGGFSQKIVRYHFCRIEVARLSYGSMPSFPAYRNLARYVCRFVNYDSYYAYTFILNAL